MFQRLKTVLCVTCCLVLLLTTTISPCCGECLDQNISRRWPEYTVDPNINMFCKTPIFGYPWMYSCTEGSNVILRLWAYDLQRIPDLITSWRWIIPGGNVVSLTENVPGIILNTDTYELQIDNIKKEFYGQYTLVVNLNRPINMSFGYHYNLNMSTLYMKTYLNMYDPLFTSHGAEYGTQWIVGICTSFGFCALIVSLQLLNRYKYKEKAVRHKSDSSISGNKELFEMKRGLSNKGILES